MINPRLKAYPAPIPSGEAVSPGTSHWFMLAMIGPGKRVLEFGCASGYMSSRLKVAGCTVTGIEVDVDAAATARTICDDVIVADLDIAPLAEIVPGATTYDVVVFGDVLEHLRDPWAVLSESRRYIAPGGFAVISIPNIAHGSVRLKLLQGDFDYSELGILDDTHLRFFTLKTVEELCLRAGFRIETIERTKVAMFAETPLTPKSKEMLFDPELIEQIRRDPEHDTLQFVIRATPLDDDEKFEVLAKELASVRDRLRDAETSASVSQEAYEEIEAELELRDRGTANLELVEDIDVRRPLARQRGKNVSARAIKRSEGLQVAIDRASAEIARERYARAQIEEAGNALADALRALRAEFVTVSQENDRLSASLRALQDKYRDAKETLARRSAAEIENERFRQTVSAALLRFVRYAESELASVTGRIADLDAAIVAVQGSRVWALKRYLGKLRR